MDHIQPHWTIRWSSSAQPLLSLMDISIHDRGWMSKLWWKGPNRTWFIWSLWMPPLQNGFWVGKRTWKLRISDKNSIEDFCNFTHRHLHCSVFIDLDYGPGPAIEWTAYLLILGAPIFIPLALIPPCIYLSRVWLTRTLERWIWTILTSDQRAL